jgi:hypothetical protein
MKRLTAVLTALALITLLATGCGSSSKSLNAGGLDLGNQLTSLIGQASSTLSGISDAGTAEEALPTLDSVNEGLSDIVQQASQLDPEARQQLTDQARKALPSWEALTSQVLTTPGVAGVIGSSVQSITEKLSFLG